MPSEETKGWNPSHDVKYTSSRKPNWKNDLAIGKMGETIFQEFLESLDNEMFEIKFDQYRNGRMVVEVEQNPRGKGWKPSGLMVTKAKWWIYLMSPDAFVAFEVERLKKYIEVNSQMEKKTFAAYSENPARGYLLYPEDVSKLLSSDLYDKEEK